MKTVEEVHFPKVQNVSDVGEGNRVGKGFPYMTEKAFEHSTTAFKFILIVMAASYSCFMVERE